MHPDFFYEFEDVRFFPRQRRLLRIQDNFPSSLTPKQSDLLAMLIKKQGDLVTYGEMKAEIWAGTSSEVDVDRNIKEVMHTLRRALGKTAAGKIETITGRGYRLNSIVVCGSDDDAGLRLDDAAAIDFDFPDKKEEQHEAVKNGNGQDLLIRGIETSRFARSFGGHVWHVIVSCSLYALLYSVALLVEVAYRFDHFGSAALKLAPLIFLWILGTSIVALAVDSRWTLQARATGLVLSLIVFIGAGLLLYIALGLFLPSVPITEATFQTYTAHGAYLKSVCYFLFLAIVFLIVPYHFVLTLHKEIRAGNYRYVFDFMKGEKLVVAPRNTIYLRVWWLGFILLCVAILSPVLAAHLFDNLRPGVYMNFFTQLVIWRILIYLFLGLECLLWYYWSLNEVKRESTHGAALSTIDLQDTNA